MNAEIKKLMEEDGITELQAYRAVQARRIIASRLINRTEERKWAIG